MSTIFDSLNKRYKSPKGPMRKNEPLFLRIKLEKGLSPSQVQVVFNEFFTNAHYITCPMNFEKSDEKYLYFEAQISNLDVNVYQYYFTFCSYGRIKFLKMCDNSWNAKILDFCDSSNWQLTVYDSIKTHPNMLGGIMYQVFIDRFYKGIESKDLPSDRVYRNWGEMPYFSNDKIGTDFFGGNLSGFISKIKYLKSLNVSVVYFNPLCRARSNHRYDTGSYEEVDPLIGTAKELKKLIRIAHDNDMIIILDMVMNHTGSDSKYFNKYNTYSDLGAYNSNNSPFYSWYYFSENNRNKYSSWWGFDTLPKVNQNDPGFIDYFFKEGGVIDKWYSLGIDGLRLDVADELEPSTLLRINEASKRNRDSIVIIGEVWDNASNKCNYGHFMNYFSGHKLTSVMNYPVSDAILAYIRYGDSWAFNLQKTLISIFIEDYPREVSHSLMNFLSSHDTVRAITKLAGKELNEHKDDKNWQNANDILSSSEIKLGKLRLMISYMLLFFLPGIPSIFYGDEVGLSGFRDPFCRKCFPWDKIDKKLLKFFRNLSKVRKEQSAFLAESDFHVCSIDDEKCIYIRTLGNKSLIVFINRTDSKVDITRDSLNLCFINKSLKKLTNCLFDTKILFSIGKDSDMTNLDPYGAILLEVIQTEK